MNTTDIVIGGHDIGPGQQKTIDLPIPHLHTHTPMSMVVHVVRGKREGPSLFISAAVHGNELNGIEIVRRLLQQKALKRIRGTLVAVPIVNSYGVIHQSRYLPDRRDLNRSFPGSESGSLTARVANLFMKEIVANATHGIDLHTGTIHRSNLPQIRADLEDQETLRLAKSFGVPVLIHAKTRDGSMRAEVSANGIPMLLYEAGEALRFDEISIGAGVKGVINVMRALGMLPPVTRKRAVPEPFVSWSSIWLRAPRSGLLSKIAPLGSHVKKGDMVGTIADPYGGSEEPVDSPLTGLVIGRTHLPLANEGDAIVHIARFKDAEEVAEQVDSFHTSQAEDSESQN